MGLGDINKGQGARSQALWELTTRYNVGRRLGAVKKPVKIKDIKNKNGEGILLISDIKIKY